MILAWRRIPAAVLFLAAFLFLFSITTMGAGASLGMYIGDIKVYKANAQSWVEATFGTALEVSDRVATGAESKAEVEFDDGSVVKVEENSILEISRLDSQGGARQTGVRNVTGSIFANIKRVAGGTFEVRSTTAVAAIRGTSFGHTVSATGLTTVKVLQGVVGVGSAAGGREVLVQPGQRTQVAQNKQPTTPEAMSREEMTGLVNWAREDIQSEMEQRSRIRRATPRAARGLSSENLGLILIVLVSLFSVGAIFALVYYQQTKYLKLAKDIVRQAPFVFGNQSNEEMVNSKLFLLKEKEVDEIIGWKAKSVGKDRFLVSFTYLDKGGQNLGWYWEANPKKRQVKYVKSSPGLDEQNN
ncbi:FecR domain-containing protein [candidate division KSB1 bacterium]